MWLHTPVIPALCKAGAGGPKLEPRPGNFVTLYLKKKKRGASVLGHCKDPKDPRIPSAKYIHTYITKIYNKDCFRLIWMGVIITITKVLKGGVEKPQG